LDGGWDLEKIRKRKSWMSRRTGGHKGEWGPNFTYTLRQGEMGTNKSKMEKGNIEKGIDKKSGRIDI